MLKRQANFTVWIRHTERANSRGARDLHLRQLIMNQSQFDLTALDSATEPTALEGLR